MKTQVVAMCFCFSFVASFAQELQYPSIDELGWYITDLNEPRKLKVDDVGAILYLVTLNKDGKVKHVKVLSNTFSARVEHSWRKQIRKATFVNINATPDKPSRQLEGTLLVTRDGCSKELASDM